MDKNIENILESISDKDFQLIIEEIKNIDDEKIILKNTIMLNEIHYQILDIWPELDDFTINMLILKEYSYRKAGLK